jgi:uncharacterized protein YjbJ (UPF0337 family)
MADDPKKQKAEGMKDKAKGRAKEAAGALADDEEKKAEGKKDKAEGEAKKQTGKARDKIKDNI